MSMKQKYTKWRRARVIDKAIINGKRLRELETARAGIDGSLWPHVAQSVELDIGTCERRAKKYLTYLKNTEAF